MSQYEVGQILYVVNENKFKIVPVQVVEEVVRTTIEGKFKTYMIQFPDKDKTVVDISTISSKCFKTEKMVKDFLLDNTRTAIDGLMDVANKLKFEAFGEKTEVKNDKNEILESVQQEEKSNIIKVDLGNGQVGNLKTDNLKG